MSYDIACWICAEHFLEKPADKKDIDSLAQHIQNAVEDWSGWPTLGEALEKSAKAATQEFTESK